MAGVTKDGILITDDVGGGGSSTTVAIGQPINATDASVLNTTPAGTEYGLLVRTIGGAGGGPATIADGADINAGATTNAAVITDVAGTLSGKLRGLVKWAFERMPASLGRKSEALSFPVVNSDGPTSVGNSSTALLGIGATFTGVFESVSAYAFFTASVFTDVASATNGLVFNWSHDGVNIDRSEGTNVNANIGRAFAITPRAKFFRIDYINGATAQGIFRLGVVYHPVGTGLITRTLSETLTDSHFVQAVRAVISARPLAGTNYVNLNAENAAPADNAFGLVVRPILSNVVSTQNSSTTPLGANATFTGAFINALEFVDVVISIFTDQGSATNGLKFDTSSDGVNIDDVDDYTILANSGKQYSVGLNSQYFRVRYTNGGIAQGVFRVKTIFKRARGKPSSHRIDDTPVTQDDAELVKAVLTAKTPGGSYVNITATTGGNLKSAIQEFDPAVLGQ